MFDDLNVEACHKKLIEETVKQTLVTLGLDVRDPIKLQKDFAHLRDWRESSEKIKSKGIVTLVGVIVTGAGGLAWVLLKDAFKILE